MDKNAQDLSGNEAILQMFGMFKWETRWLPSGTPIGIIGTQFLDDLRVWWSKTGKQLACKDVCCFWDIALLSCSHLGRPCYVLRFHWRKNLLITAVCSCVCEALPSLASTKLSCCAFSSVNHSPFTSLVVWLQGTKRPRIFSSNFPRSPEQSQRFLGDSNLWQGAARSF